MQYKIFGESLPAVTLTLNAGESIYTQSGGMTWMTAGVQMETNMKGGLLKGLGRMLTGDSLFIATYSATAANQEVTIASTFPGAIVAIDPAGGDVIAQKSAFLCAEPGVTVSAHVVKNLSSGLFGGEGFVLQRLSGTGLAFLEIDGAICEKTLGPGESLIVDTGNIAAYEANVAYEVTMVKGFKNILLGGEGLLNTRLTGPGKVWLQTMTMPGFAKRIIPFLPTPSSTSTH
jgi:uncharacterized protein (TIGR00266 family)